MKKKPTLVSKQIVPCDNGFKIVIKLRHEDGALRTISKNGYKSEEAALEGLEIKLNNLFE